ncbi:MAG: hypothetical protein ACYDAO_07595 [Thermoplasmataceae archaeon]
MTFKVETSTISFSAVDGTYSYTIGAVSGYSVSPSSGSVSVSGGSKSVAVTYTEQPTNCPAIGYVGIKYSCNEYNNGQLIQQNLTSSINNAINTGEDTNNLMLQGELTSLQFSIPYKNANKGNGNVNSYVATNSPVVSPDVQIEPTPNPGGTLFRGILVYTLTSSGGWGSPIECDQAISGNGTLSFSWRTAPGVYGGFMVELVTNNGIARTYYKHPFDVYSRLVNCPGTQNPCYLDSYAGNNVYTSGGVFIGVLGISASRGATKAGGNSKDACGTDTTVRMGLSTEFLSPCNNVKENTFKYGIFNYNQYLNYTGSQNGRSNQLPKYMPICALNQAQSSNNANSGPGTKLAEEAIYDLVETGLLMSPSPITMSVGVAMTALGPFLFQGSAPQGQQTYWNRCFSQSGISYGSWDQGGSGSNKPPDSSGCVLRQTPRGMLPEYFPVYTIVNNGNGNPSFMQYYDLHLVEPMIPNETSGVDFGLNFYTYTTSATIVPILHSLGDISIKQNDYVNATWVCTDGWLAQGYHEYSGPSYTAATSMQIYMPMEG